MSAAKCPKCRATITDRVDGEKRVVSFGESFRSQCRGFLRNPDDYAPADCADMAQTIGNAAVRAQWKEAVPGPAIEDDGLPESRASRPADA